MPKRMLALVCGLILSVTAFAQQITVNGNVKDAAGEPIIGATVRVAGQSGGVITDYDGNFQIQANSGATITVTFVGYQDAQVAAAPRVNIVLEDDASVPMLKSSPEPLRWHFLDGRPTAQPLLSGVYIRGKEKVVVK